MYMWWTDCFRPSDSLVVGIVAGLLIAGIFILIEIGFTRRFIDHQHRHVGVVFVHRLLHFRGALFQSRMNKLPEGFREWVQFSSMAIFVYLAVIRF